MQYYSIDNATSDIGKYFPQVQNMEMAIGKTVNDDDFVWKIEGDKLPNFKPYIGTLILKEGALMTDFISTASISTGFVCSDKVENIIRQHSFGLTNFYELIVKHKGQYFSNYKLMHCVNNYTKSIDYSKSKFKRYKIENNKKVGEIYHISSFNEIVALKNELSKNKYGDWCFLEPYSIKFKEGFQPIHDIFIMWGLTNKTYISERLRESFENANISGIQYDFDVEHINFS
jgi:hypothetical protein